MDAPAESAARRRPETATAGPNHIVGLDLVRFAAAFSVMLFHYFSWSQLAPNSTGARILDTAAPFADGVIGPTWFGWVGVQVFFVISGFVIGFSAENATAASFARARVLRLAPAAWICASLTLAVAVAIGFGKRTVLAAEYARSVLFSPIGPYIDGVYWTLGVEISFYALVFALLLVSRVKHIERLAIAIGSMSCVFLFASAIVPVQAYDIGQRLTELALLRHGVFFAMGVSIWAWLRRGPSMARLAFFAMMMIGAWREIDLTSVNFLAGMHMSQATITPKLAFSAAVALIVFSVFANRVFTDSWLIGPLRTLGLATYPLYLIHQFVGTEILNLLINGGVAPMAAAWITIGTCVLAAIVIATALEPPLRAALRTSIQFAASRLGSAMAKVQFGTPRRAN